MAKQDPNPGPKKSGWRGQPGGGRTNRDTPHWTRTTTGQDELKQQSRRRMKRYGVSAAVLVLIGMLVWLLYIPLKTPMVLVTITDYASPVPPNAWAGEDADRFVSQWTENARGVSRLFRGAGSVSIYPAGEQWHVPSDATPFKTLGTIRPGGPKKDVVLLYISAHGIVDDEGHPALVLAMPPRLGAGVGEPLPALPLLKVQSLLEHIKQSFKPEVKKLVLLDCQRIDTRWNLGVLYNGFGELLAETIHDAEVPNLAVLTSAGPGQVGWASPAIGGTPFGFFVRQALHGYADKSGDGKVSLLELHEYVNTHVKSWVFEHFYDLQEPQLLAAEAIDAKSDFAIVYTEARPPSDPREHLPKLAFEERGGDGKSAVADRVDPFIASSIKLKELWDAHERLQPWQSEQSGRRRDLLSWEAFQQGLLHWERLIWAGGRYEKDADALQQSLTSLAGALQAGPRTTPPAHSLALVSERINNIERDLVGKFLRGEMIEGGPPDFRKFSYYTRAKTAWDWLQQEGVTLTRMQRALQCLPPSNSEPDYVEIRYLRLLAARGPQDVPLLTDKVSAVGDLLQASLECRQKAEQAAASQGDRRVWYCIKAVVEQGDKLRRAGEDALLVGETEDVALARKAFADARTRYEAAEGTARQMGKALDARDRAYAELPYLAMWLTRRSSMNAGDKQNDEAMALCLKTIERAHRLAADIGTVLETSLGNQPPPPDRFQRLGLAGGVVDDDRRKLLVSYQDEVQRLIKRAADRKKLREALDVLVTPLVTGSARLTLLRSAIDSARQADDETTEGALPESSDSANHLIAVRRWQPHPAVAVLERKWIEGAANLDVPGANAKETSPDKSGGGKPASAAERLKWVKDICSEGTAVRGKLHRLAADSRLWLSQDKSTDASRPALAQARAPRAVADALIRASAVLANLPPRYSDSEEMLADPIGKLDQFDGHHFLVWEATRTCDDFLGAAGGLPDQPYFAATAQSYLAAARLLDPRQSSEFRFAEQHLTQRTAAAPNFATVLAKERVLSGEERLLTFPISIAPAAGAPAGRAAVTLVAGTEAVNFQFAGQQAPHARLGQELAEGASATPPEHSLTVNLGQKSPPPLWHVVSYYRGHALDTPVQVVAAGQSRDIIALRPQYSPPQVVVSGEGDDPGAIAFVLDCSGSMIEKQFGNPKSRMEHALFALRGMLELLADAGDFRVSLWLYGHRRGINPNPPPPFTWNDKFGPEDKSVLPSDDVQLVIPSERLNPNSPIFRLFQGNKIRPVGRTPLYLSIFRAVKEDLGEQNKKLPRRLIVITDGENLTWVEKADSFRPAFPDKTEADVIGAIKDDAKTRPDDRIQLTIIHCGSQLGGAEAMQRIVKDDAASGKFLPVQNIQQLAQTLKDAIGVREYTISNSNSEIVAQSHLNKAVELKPGEYVARLAGSSQGGSKFTVEGGEILQLKLQRVGQNYQLVHKPFEPEVANELKTVENPDRDEQPQQFRVAALLPRSIERQVRFPVLVQNAIESAFSPRPQEAWVEITPVADAAVDGAQSAPFVLYDLAFEEKTPVPVLDWRIADWPAGVTSASLQMWFKMHRTTPTKEYLVQDVSGVDERPRIELETADGKINVAVKVTSLPGSQRGCEIQVIEFYEPQAPDVMRLKCSVYPDDAAGIKHQYFSDPAIRQVRHIYSYPNKRESDVQTYKLRLTTKADLQAGAVKLPRPMKVTIRRGQ